VQCWIMVETMRGREELLGVRSSIRLDDKYYMK
jgi:hypothetical protein